MDFKVLLNEKIQEIDKYIESCIPDENTFPEAIFKAMRYSVFAGGKRLRPILVTECCKALGGNVSDAMPFAAAIEFIHTYSLIHDDLPAMDNDDFRRGKPTNHKVFGENIAILAGDALLNHAFEIMLNACVKSGDYNMTCAAAIIASGAGTKGMIGGQVVDVLNDGKAIDEKTLLYIHKNKTGAMIASAMKAGAVLAGADRAVASAFEQAGYDIGLAFQIQDDILDVTSTTKELGKPVHSDEKNLKTTYITMYGIEKSKHDVEFYSKRAVETLSSICADTDFLIELTNYLIKRKY